MVFIFHMQKEDFVCNAANAPSIMVFLQWFTETQMFEVYTTERENDRNVISGKKAQLPKFMTSMKII